MTFGPQIGDGGHDRRVGRLSMEIGRQLGMAHVELDVLGRGACCTTSASSRFRRESCTRTAS